MRFLRYLRKSPTAKNASASYFATLSMGVSAFVSIPIAVHFLKKEEIGLWAVVSAVVNYLTWMDLGIGDGIGRKIAASVAAKDRAEINRWWTVSIFALSLLGMLLVVVGGALTPWMISVFEVPSQLTSQAYILFLGSIVLVGIGLPYRGAPGLLTAQQRFHWVSLAQGIAPWKPDYLEDSFHINQRLSSDYLKSRPKGSISKSWKLDVILNAGTIDL